MDTRTNEDWVAALQGESGNTAEAVRDLERYLERIVGRVAKGRLGAEAVGEAVQESIVRIIERLSSFRGDSAFTTWAAGIATRVVFTEFRRRSAQERGRHEFDDVLAEAEDGASPMPSAHDIVSKDETLAALERAVAELLSERQRTAILAELRGLPTIEIARRLKTNRNALYKLTHDARKKLRSALVDSDSTRAAPEMPW